MPADDRGHVRIGCSGWLYRHWRGGFYPERLAVKRWFEHYAATFDTVEINSSFYRLPAATTFEGWRRQAPPRFRYAVKANRFITQAKKLNDCAEPLAEMLSRTRRLERTLGPILFQLPPRFKANRDRLANFLALLPRELSAVFEFRDPSWYDDAILALLERHEAGLVVHDLPGFASPRLATGPVVYVRCHGGQGKYWGRYSEAALLGWCDWIATQAAQGRAVWAYFNNDVGGAAIEDAQVLRAMVRQALPAAVSPTMEDA